MDVAKREDTGGSNGRNEPVVNVNYPQIRKKFKAVDTGGSRPCQPFNQGVLGSNPSGLTINTPNISVAGNRMGSVHRVCSRQCSQTLKIASSRVNSLPVNIRSILPPTSCATCTALRPQAFMVGSSGYFLVLPPVSRRTGRRRPLRLAGRPLTHGPLHKAAIRPQIEVSPRDCAAEGRGR